MQSKRMSEAISSDAAAKVSDKPEEEAARSASICGNPACKKPGDKKCGNCGSVLYCGKECATRLWPFHKLACRFRLQEQAPCFMQKPVPLGVPNYQVQMANVLAALDASVRIVSGDVEVTKVAEPGKPQKAKKVSRNDAVPHAKEGDTAVIRTGLLKIESVTECEDVCPARRFVQFRIGQSTTFAQPGGDLFAQLVEQGAAPASVVRLSYLNRSLKFCVTFALALEALAAQRTLHLMHGRERLGMYYIARGHVKSIQPRLDVVGAALQSLPEANDHWAMLFVPIASVPPSEVAPNENFLEDSEKIANMVENGMLVLETRWEKEFGNLPLPVDVSKPAEPTPAAAESKEKDQAKSKLLAALRDVGVFLAPAACEADACLYMHRLRKGVPGWFHIEEIYQGADFDKLPITPAISDDARLRCSKMCRILFGPSFTQANVVANKHAVSARLAATAEKSATPAAVAESTGNTKSQ